MDISDPDLRPKLHLLDNGNASRTLVHLWDVWHGYKYMPFDHSENDQIRDNSTLNTLTKSHFLTMGILTAISKTVAPLIGESSTNPDYSDIFFLNDRFNPSDQGSDSQVVTLESDY